MKLSFFYQYTTNHVCLVLYSISIILYNICLVIFKQFLKMPIISRIYSFTLPLGRCFMYILSHYQHKLLLGYNTCTSVGSCYKAQCRMTNDVHRFHKLKQNYDLLSRHLLCFQQFYESNLFVLSLHGKFLFIESFRMLMILDAGKISISPTLDS